MEGSYRGVMFFMDYCDSLRCLLVFIQYHSIWPTFGYKLNSSGKVKSRYMSISYTLSKLGDLFMSSNVSITLLWDFVQSNFIWPTFGHKMDQLKQLSLKSCNHLGQNL